MRNAHFRQTAVYGADFDVTVFHAVRLNSVIMSLALSVDDVHMRFALAMTTWLSANETSLQCVNTRFL